MAPLLETKNKKKQESYTNENEIQNNNENKILNDKEKIRKSSYLNEEEESCTFFYCKHWSKRTRTEKL